MHIKVFLSLFLLPCNFQVLSNFSLPYICMQCMHVVCVYVCGLVCMPMCRSRSHRMVLHSCSLTLYTIAQKQGLSLSLELGWHLASPSESSRFFHFIMLGYRHSHTWLFPLVLGFEIRSSHLCSKHS